MPIDRPEGWQPMPIRYVADPGQSRVSSPQRRGPRIEEIVMNEIDVNGVRLAYDVQGEGEPMLVVHGGFWADVLRPLTCQSALDGYRRIQYHRRGYGESSGPAGGFDVQVADAVALLDHLGVDAAHVVGHSEGAMIGLALAAAHPERVRSLSLLEPLAPTGWLATNGFGAVLEMFGAVAEASIGRYQAGDPEGATDVIFAETIPDWRDNVETAAPGGLAKADWATFYETEFAGLGEWRFGPEQATVISCPVLSWKSDQENPISAAGRAFLHDLFPRCEDADLAGATHFSPFVRPAEVAEQVAAFLARHSAVLT
jgi:pimeloyl-ACP methyl ester carboxylesterase